MSGIMRPRVSGAAGVLLLLAAVLLPITVASGAPTEQRVEGDDPYDTVVLTSQEAFPAGAEVAVLAAENADGLTGPVLAHALDGPLLVTPTHDLPQVVADELDRLGVQTVYLMGGPAAVSQAVEDEITGQGRAAIRLADADRYGTAVVVSEHHAVPGDPVVVASGQSLANAIVGASEAVRQDASLLLTPNDNLDAGASDEIQRLDPDSITIVGGEIADAVVQQLQGMADSVERLDAVDSRILAQTVAGRGDGVAGQELTTAQRPFIAADGFAASLAGVGNYSPPFMYAEGDAVIRETIEETEPELLRLLGSASTTPGEDSTPPGGVYTSAPEATPGQLAVAVQTFVGGVITATPEDAFPAPDFPGSPDPLVPFTESMKVELPAAAEPNLPSRITLRIDLADVPPGTGHDDVRVRLGLGTALIPACESDVDAECVRDRGIVGDDLFLQVQTRASHINIEGAALAMARRSGTDRYETGNGAATQQPLHGGASDVYVATGQAFPDALAAAAIAGAQGSRVLITPGDGRPDALVDGAIDTLAADGALVVGGDAAVRDGSVTAAPALRIAGRDRYETASLMATSAYPDGAPVVFLATGADFPDALTAAVAAALASSPVLLTATDALPQHTIDAIAALEPEAIAVVGGEAAVSSAVVDQVEALGVPTQRFEGNNRFETAVAISEAAFPAGAEVAYLATGAGFADALTGAPIAAQAGGPLLLVRQDAIPTATAAELERLQPRRVVVLGGTGAVSDAVMGQAEGYLR